MSLPTLLARVMVLSFDAGMKESFATHTLVKDVRPPIFYSLLTYLYTDTLQLDCPEDIMELLVVANQVKVAEMGLASFVRCVALAGWFGWRQVVWD